MMSTLKKLQKVDELEKENAELRGIIAEMLQSLDTIAAMGCHISGFKNCFHRDVEAVTEAAKKRMGI